MEFRVCADFTKYVGTTEDVQKANDELMKFALDKGYEIRELSSMQSVRTRIFNKQPKEGE